MLARLGRTAAGLPLRRFGFGGGRRAANRFQVRQFARNSYRYDRRERRSLVPKDPPRRPDGNETDGGRGGFLFKAIGVTGLATMGTLYMYYVMNVGARPMEDRIESVENYGSGRAGQLGRPKQGGVDPWSSDPSATHGESVDSGARDDNVSFGNSDPFPNNDPWESKNARSGGSSSSGSKWT